jgi:hypothetical protein
MATLTDRLEGTNHEKTDLAVNAPLMLCAHVVRKRRDGREERTGLACQSSLRV